MAGRKPNRLPGLDGDLLHLPGQRIGDKIHAAMIPTVS
jgi:hypothetical protein